MSSSRLRRSLFDDLLRLDRYTSLEPLELA